MIAEGNLLLDTMAELVHGRCQVSLLLELVVNRCQIPIYERATCLLEAFIQDASIKNSFLVKGTLKSDEAKLGLYPQGHQRQATNHAFACYFSVLGAALR